MTRRFDATPVLDHLRDFQRASVEHAFRRLYLDDDSTKRFLIADETGLGKTHVARGVIAKTIEYLQDLPHIKRIDIVYVCSNADIAEQNLRKLNVGDIRDALRATRLTLLVGQPTLLAPITSAEKPVTLVSFTPSTSFELGWRDGNVEERAILYLLIAQRWEDRHAWDTALRRILQGGVATLKRFSDRIEAKRRELYRRGSGEGLWQPSIKAAFSKAFNQSRLLRELDGLVDEVAGHGSLTVEQKGRARSLTGSLRTLLARASVNALDPDLIILDEFQRFKDLLIQSDERSEAAELADHLFTQKDARVLLLSATPYKPFTRSDESIEEGEDHYSDFYRTLAFLDPASSFVPTIKTELADFRRLALNGGNVAEVRPNLEARLTKLLTRTERPSAGFEASLIETICKCEYVRPGEFAGYVALHRLAEAVGAPLSVEYWKSAPYFANFLDGYQLGEKIKDALHDEVRRQNLRPLLRMTQRLRPRDLRNLQVVDWANSRLRQLAADTVEIGLWKLLWIPASLPYYHPAGVFAEPEFANVTKRLVFSSWVAAPTAIASLLSYAAERNIHRATGKFESLDEARRGFNQRLQFRLDGGRAAAMTTLAILWPNPALADMCDPLVAAHQSAESLLQTEQVLEWARLRVSTAVEEGSGSSSASTAWIPVVAVAFGREDSRNDGRQATVESVVQAWMAAVSSEEDGQDENDTDTKTGLTRHLQEAVGILIGQSPGVERPTNLARTTALIGLASPGNVAWRALKRLAGETLGRGVTLRGLWAASIALSLGFRALFNRLESTFLLDSLYPGDETAYWEAVLKYCLDGNLQAVTDEYLHHLAESEGISTDTDEGLLKLARAAIRGLTIRPARYKGADIEHPEGGGIPLPSRFALRFGNIRQELDDVRLPEVRAAFNSPFWPFVLASTSIGQEGVDFHWWCHAVVHWNLPANPVDFEQREGRVNRFKGHAIRKNVAERHGRDVLNDKSNDPWTSLFARAAKERDAELGDLKPYWIFPGKVRIERYIPQFPLSKDESQWREMRDTLALYRLCFGQPRQEDMLDLLARRGVGADAQRVQQLGLRLYPPKGPAGSLDSAHFASECTAEDARASES